MQSIDEDHVDRVQLDARPGVGIHVETKKNNVLRIGAYVPPRVLQRVQAVVHSDNMAKQLGKMLRREAAPNAKPEKGQLLCVRKRAAKSSWNLAVAVPLIIPSLTQSASRACCTAGP